MCFEFELLRSALRGYLADFGVAHGFNELDLADLLDDYGISRLDQLPDVISVARNLQFGVAMAA